MKSENRIFHKDIAVYNDIFRKKYNTAKLYESYVHLKHDYINNNTQIIIICKEHGEFTQSPSDHLSGCGCNICGRNNMIKKQRSSTEEFISKAILTHSDKYDYSKVNYITAREKVIIICKKHGDFPQTPDSHLRGVGCPLCVNKTEAKLYEKMKHIYPSLL